MISFPLFYFISKKEGRIEKDGSIVKILKIRRKYL
jgi:hypothetical protein